MKDSPIFPIAAILLAFCMVLPPAVLASTISFHPSSILLYADGNDSVTVTIDELPEGLSGYYFTANVTNPEVAEISHVSFPEWASLNTTTIVPSSQVRIGATDVEDQVVAGATNVVLATIALRAKTAGSAALDVQSININDDSGMLIEPTVNAASVTVASSSGSGGSSSGSWSAGAGSGSGSSGGSSDTSPLTGTTDGTTPEGTLSTTGMSNAPSGRSDLQDESPDESASQGTSGGPPVQPASPSGAFPIPSLWIVAIVIMVGAAASVLYLAVTRRL